MSPAYRIGRALPGCLILVLATIAVVAVVAVAVAVLEPAWMP